MRLNLKEKELLNSAHKALRMKALEPRSNQLLLEVSVDAVKAVRSLVSDLKKDPDIGKDINSLYRYIKFAKVNAESIFVDECLHCPLLARAVTDSYVRVYGIDIVPEILGSILDDIEESFMKDKSRPFERLKALSNLKG